MIHSVVPKIYPNPNSAAAISADREQVFRVRSFAGNYRINRGQEHGQYVPNSRFIFATTMCGETLLHQCYRHPALAQGGPVLYAGEAISTMASWSGGAMAAAITGLTPIMPRSRVCR